MRPEPRLTLFQRVNRRVIFAAVPCLLLAALGMAIQVRAATATIETENLKQVIRGFGGATVFTVTGFPANTPLSTTELDAIFGNAPGQLGFTILRIRVASDDAWRAVELANAQGAIARGAIVMATPWSPPASMKTNNSTIAGSLKTSSYAEYATYLNDFATYMARNGAPLYGISVQNEPDISVTYESCDWTAAQMLDFCRNYAGSIIATRVIAPESYHFDQKMSDPILNDDTACANVSIIGGHIYGGGLVAYPLASAKGKELWMTEHLDSVNYDWNGAMLTAKEIHDCLATANFNAYIWWYLKRYYGPLGEDNVITKRGYVMSQFSRFIRPGYIRIAATANPTNGVYVSAYRRDKIVIVAVNQSASDAPQTFSITGAQPTTVTPYVTSATLNVAQQTAIVVSGGSFTATLPASSVTTFVGDLPVAAPAITASPKGHSMEAGDTIVLEVSTSGDYLSYQWNHDGTSISGATSRMLTLKNLQDADAGAYTATVYNTSGSVTSAAAMVNVLHTGNPGHLSGISTRSPVGLDDSVQIGGFIVDRTSATKRVIVRASGPALQAQTGMANTLADPTIELHQAGVSTVLGSNDDWDSALSPIFKKCGIPDWSAGSKDAAMLANLGSGGFSAIVKGKADTTGVALVEVYDADDAGAAGRLAGLSSRTAVGVDDDVQIAGFIVAGATAQTIVIRASGPTMGKTSALPGALADPTMELYELTQHKLLATNDDWDPALSQHFVSVFLSPLIIGSKDSALVITLDPGAYSVVVSGKNRTTGLAMVEVYSE